MLIDKQNNSWPGWETVRLIGRGSFGAVYEITRNIFGNIERAALKVISIPHHSSDINELYSEGYDKESITNTFQNHLKSILAEYSLMRKMNGCANVVNCDDVLYIQHDDGIGWDILIKMELLTPLADALPQQISEDTVLKIAKDICTALELCRKHGILHRDIKPQNIFVSPNGDYKLGDFGIAKTVEKTTRGTKIGTYKYMAPEVYNNNPYGCTADIYSVGLLLYWLLNERRMPFLPLPPAKHNASMDEAAWVRRLSGEQFNKPKHGSEALKSIVMKACSYNAEDRYATAAEMLMDINRIGQMRADDMAPVFAVTSYAGQANTYENETFGVFHTSNRRKDTESQTEHSATDTSPKLREKSLPSEHEEAEDPIASPQNKMRKTATERRYKASIAVLFSVIAVLILVLAFVLQSKANTNSAEKQPGEFLNSIATEEMAIDNKPADSLPEETATEVFSCSHQWTAATCTKKSTCTLCGIETGTLTDHQWLPPTKKAPMRCSICAQTKGEIKSFSGGSYGAMSYRLIRFTNWDVRPYTMNTEVKNCVSFTLTLSLWNVEYGSPYGIWEVYCKDENGNWVHVADIDVVKNQTSIEISLDEPLSFTEVAVNRTSAEACKHKYEFKVTSYVVYIE